MGQEFFIKSDTLQQKVDQLLPSQGGLGAGFDLSASTQIVPIVDLTESAEGSNLRADLQTSFSLDSVTAHSVINTSTVLINNVGYFRVFGYFAGISFTGTSPLVTFQLTDGVTTKNITQYFVSANTNIQNILEPYDFVVKIEAGQSLVCVSNSTSARAVGVTRQIADINGDLVNP
jgi:hypothetical protein